MEIISVGSVKMYESKDNERSKLENHVQLGEGVCVGWSSFKTEMTTTGVEKSCKASYLLSNNIFIFTS